MSYGKWNKGKRSYQVQRMWLQNNVQEKDKKMYPFTSALECLWKAVDGDKRKQNRRFKKSHSNSSGSKINTVQQATIAQSLQSYLAPGFLFWHFLFFSSFRSTLSYYNMLGNILWIVDIIQHLIKNDFWNTSCRKLWLDLDSLFSSPPSFFQPEHIFFFNCIIPVVVFDARWCLLKTVTSWYNLSDNFVL